MTQDTTMVERGFLVHLTLAVSLMAFAVWGAGEHRFELAVILVTTIVISLLGRHQSRVVMPDVRKTVAECIEARKAVYQANIDKTDDFDRIERMRDYILSLEYLEAQIDAALEPKP